MKRTLSASLTRARAIRNTIVLLLKVFPMLHARPVDWVTARPTIERFHYPTSHGDAVGDLYLPGTRGPHPAMLVCLGVVPFGVEHPQVPRLGEALARSGFAALLYWSPAMRDFQLDPADVGDIASAYDTLIARDDVDRARSGLLGTCVGGAFALMASGDPRIRDRIAFVLAYAPYASMHSLVVDIASATTPDGDARTPWDVDPLTRTVYVHSLTALLPPDEARSLRETYAQRDAHAQRNTPSDTALSEAGLAVAPLLTALDAAEAETAIGRLPTALQDRFHTISPTTYRDGIRAPLVILLHDRDDPVIPVAESRTLRDALAALRPVRYTEFTVFKHLDPTRSNPSPLALVRELTRFARAIYPAYHQAASTASHPPQQNSRHSRE